MRYPRTVFHHEQFFPCWDHLQPANCSGNEREGGSQDAPGQGPERMAASDAFILFLVVCSPASQPPARVPHAACGCAWRPRVGNIQRRASIRPVQVRRSVCALTSTRTCGFMVERSPPAPRCSLRGYPCAHSFEKCSNSLSRASCTAVQVSHMTVSSTMLVLNKV